MNIFKKLLNKKQSNTQVFHISLENMLGSFQHMQYNAGWDIRKKMFWGYYFLDSDVNKLETFGHEMKKYGFEVVEIRELPDNQFLLHVEEHVVHSAKSLFDQCHKLAKLAKTNNIEIFDGWDVEPIQMNKGLVE